MKSDEPVGAKGTISVVNAVKDCLQESRRSDRRQRLDKSAKNWDLYLGHQNFDNKQEGQSCEFLPKTAQATEQFAGFVERALTKYQNPYNIDLPADVPIRAESVKKILDFYLNNLPDKSAKNPAVVQFAQRAADLVKFAMHRSIMVAKVYGTEIAKPYARVEPGEFSINPTTGAIERNESSISIQDKDHWRLAIDLIPDEDYFKDPTGNGLYEIHQVTRDINHLYEMAEQGVYDKSVVDQIESDFSEREEQEFRTRRRERNSVPRTRKQVVITEFWGTLLDDNGKVAQRNIVTTIANEKYLLRPPIKNPNWNGESCFVEGQLIRVPLSNYHKALYDDAGPLNEALNELFNLMLDGSIGSVWGVKEVRTDYLENPEDLDGGLTQNETLHVKASAPPDVAVVRPVQTGQVPREALNMYSILDSAFNAAAFTNEIALGSVPGGSVKATSVVEASKSQAVTLDSLVGNIENFLTRIIKKSWDTVVQQAPNFIELEAIRDVFWEDAVMLGRLTPEERFALLGESADLKVVGISGSVTRARDFQRLMALIQGSVNNPFLLQALVRRYDPEKVLELFEKQLDISSQEIRRDSDSQKRLPSDEKQVFDLMQQFLGINGQNGSNSLATDSAQLGSASNQSEINQNINPSEVF